MPIRVIVSDTSCLIDLDKGQLLAETLRLPFEFMLPDLLFSAEVHRLQHTDVATLPDLGLTLVEIPGDGVARAQTYQQTNKRLSFYDCLALVLTEDTDDAMLLTGDGALRTEAENRGLVVHGTLWAIDRLDRLAGLEPARLVRALELYRADPMVRIADDLIDRHMRRYRQ